MTKIIILLTITIFAFTNITMGEVCLRNPLISGDISEEKEITAVKFTILLVDDKIDFLIYAKGLLEKEGYVILTAYSMNTALEELDRSDIDLVLSDLRTGDKEEGFKLVEEMQTRKIDIPVIIWTSDFHNTSVEDHARAQYSKRNSNWLRRQERNKTKHLTWLSKKSEKKRNFIALTRYAISDTMHFIELKIL